MDMQARLAELAKLPPASRPVVSVYLDTRWTDEDQRERVRIFLKNHLREARARATERPAEDDLEWIEAQGQRLVAGDVAADSSGVALFAGGDGLRVVLPVRAAFADAFVIDARPYLRPLAAAIDEIVPALVVFVDGAHARLLALSAQGPAEDVALDGAVEGRHATGGWAALAQTRYQRHIEEHRGQHYEATAAAIRELIPRHGVRRIMLAGEARAVAVFRSHLSADLDRRIVGVVAAAAHEPMATIATRAAERLAQVDEQDDAEAVDRLLEAAATGGGAVVGIAASVEAVNRNAVQQLYLVAEFEQPGAVCERCSALQEATPAGRCRFCAGTTAQAELGEAMVERVLASGGSVGVVGRHAGLATRGAVGGILRYGG